jgi:Ner family transcriptional regulator
MKINPKKIPADPLQRAEWIKRQLHGRGMSLRKLGAAHGLFPAAMSFALSRPHARAEEVIADALGTTPQVLFRERFDDDGLRLHLRRDRQVAAA